MAGFDQCILSQVPWAMVLFLLFDSMNLTVFIFGSMEFELKA